MCGIAGAITWQSGSEVDLLGFDIDRLAYRGPDARCTQASVQLEYPPTAVRWKLAHARLSIVDLAPTANQPMSSPDERHWIVFNGEIYNHRALRTELEQLGQVFRTDHSDTEVLLNACRAWGVDCLSRLNGMFAFVFIDNLTGTVFAARDRMGIKPFYYRFNKGVFTFASEPKAILGERTVDRSQLLSYFNFLQAAGSSTFYREINKLPAGHYMLLSGPTAPQAVRYWLPVLRL